MELTRIVHPVGQGAFYTEELCYNGKYFNAVYDCGTLTTCKNKTREELIEHRIKCYLSNLKKTEIDIIFISHLHEDHINGIDYLIKNAKVKYLFLPQLISETIIETYLYNYISVGKVDNISNNLLSLLITEAKIYSYKDEKFKTQIKYVPITKKNISINDNEKLIIAVNYAKEDKNFIIKFENSISNNSNDFLYIPYNLDIENKTDKFKKDFIEKIQGLYDKNKILQDNLQKQGIKKEDIESIVSNIKSLNILKIIVESIGIKECKKIYKEIFGNNHNSYSMALFSGNKRDNVDNEFVINKKCFKCLNLYNKLLQNISKNKFWEIYKTLFNKKSCYNINPNCLYTGDFEVKNNFNKLKDFYSNLKLWNTIKTIQVPHHCSRKNYFSKLYSNIYSCFISVGIKNKYKHPNIDTLINIQKKVCDVNIVTEHKSTKKIYKYIIK